jgi:hypothetical protein
MQPIKRVGDASPDGSPILTLAPRGLAIYPVRYAVLPDTPAFAAINLPGSMGAKVKDVALQHHKYALRLLRKGFIYVYYHEHPDNKKWDIYEVGEDSKLKELSVAEFKKGNLKSICANMSHFFIDKPAEQGKVDFAFSEHPWSKETLDTMESDGSLRDKRMQTFRPAEWVGAPHFPHGLPVTEDNLKHVMEYSDEMEAYSQLHPDEVAKQAISDDNGKHNANTLNLCTSADPFYMRSDDLEPLVKEINIAPKSKRNQPMMLALWDSVGITRELGGFAMDAAGWVNQYQEKWALHLNAINNIDMAKASIEAVAKAKSDKRLGRDRILPRFERQRQRMIKEAEHLYTHSHISQLNNRIQGGLSDPSAEVLDPVYSHELEMKKLNERESEYRERLEKDNNDSIAESWEKYKDEIDNDAVDDLRNKHQVLMDAAEPLIDQRIKDQVAWLESTYLINALTEYHQESLVDSQFFEDLVGDVLLGMNGCQVGIKKIDEWVKECAITDGNLFWRAIASNNIKAKSALDPVLAQAKGQLEIVADGDTIAGLNKDIYGRLVDVIKLNSDSLTAAENATSIAGHRIPTGGIDKIYSAMGSRLITPLIKPGVDTVGSAIIRLVYMGKLQMDVQAEGQKLQSRLKELKTYYHNRVTQLSHAINNAEQSMQQAASSRNRSMRSMLSMHQSNLTKAQNAMRHVLAEKVRVFDKAQISYTEAVEAATASNQDNMLKSKNIIGKPGTALSVLILTLQGVSINQLLSALGTKKENGELYAQLTVASTAIVASVAGLAESFTKTGSYWSNALKIGGGGLMVISGVVSAGLDIKDAFKQYKKGNTGLVLAYSVKAALNIGATAFSAGSVYAAISASFQATTVRATARLILSRVLFLFSAWIGVAILVIDVLIMIFSDDDLEDWLQRTPFASDPEGKPFAEVGDTKKALEEQQKVFDESIMGIFGLEPEKTPEQMRQEKNEEKDAFFLNNPMP